MAQARAPRDTGDPGNLVVHCFTWNILLKEKLDPDQRRWECWVS
jgi:hypothetical protein